MQTWQIQRFGQPLVLCEEPTPSPSPTEVEITVAACGLNFADLLMMKGEYQETPSVPFAPGLEVAGTISALGSAVHHLEIGQRVAAFVGSGGLASHCLTDAARVVPLPDGMGFDIAAGFHIAYGTSHLALTRRADLHAGETLLVLGAGGGVGLTAVEIGKALGARVIAYARGDDKLEAARRAGADILLDSNAADLLEKLKELGGVDVVYDAVGGTLGDTALRACRPEARYLLIGFASGTHPQLKPNHLLVKNTSILGFYWGGYLKFAPEILTTSLTQLIDLYMNGKLAPHVGRIYAFSDAPEALNALKHREVAGKIVVAGPKSSDI